MTEVNNESYGSVSLVRQGEHRFFSLTMPSEVLAETCFVVNRDEDPIEGFQRELDKKRAQEIATYIDSGLGTIPSSIVLSAQDEANLVYDARKKTITFKKIPKAFLIIDGQHRVYGFTLASSVLRVPVIIYSGLSKRDETRLFIDINSKQKGVPPELLLDIKKLAEYESNQEEFLREIFDTFLKDTNSALYNRLSPSSKVAGKITRATFNTSMKPLVKIFGGKTEFEVYDALNSYFIAFNDAILEKNNCRSFLYNPVAFRALCSFFPTVANKVKDRNGAIYTVDNFYSFLESISDRIKKTRLEKPGSSYKVLLSYFEDSLKGAFTL